MKAYYHKPYVPQCTAFVFAKQYYDSDSGKFVRDKIEKINSYSLSDIIDDGENGDYTRHSRNFYYRPPVTESAFGFPRFEPKYPDIEDDIIPAQTEHITISAIGYALPNKWVPK